MERNTFFTLLTHIATGVALFVAAAGGMWAFFTYLHISIPAALAAAVIGIVPGLFMLLIAEGLYVLLEILKEKRRQSELLERIATQTGHKEPSLPQGTPDENLPDH